MAELIRRVGANLVGLHHRLILVIPELSETVFFSVPITKPNRSSTCLKYLTIYRLAPARDHMAARYQSE